jgi:hypothetical protein
MPLQAQAFRYTESCAGGPKRQRAFRFSELTHDCIRVLRAKDNSERHLRKHAERTGRGFVSAIGSGGERSFADGNHHSSMIAFEDGKDATITCTFIVGPCSRSSKRLSFLKTASDLSDANESKESMESSEFWWQRCRYRSLLRMHLIPAESFYRAFSECDTCCK